MNTKKIALISEHASPLAALGGVDAGGQNIAVGELAQHLASIGYEVDVFTRWDDRRLPETVFWRGGVRIVHIKAGPVSYIPKEELLPHMTEFTNNVLAFFKREKYPYKLIHAHFFMSALVAADIKKALGIPYVVTFHALGKVRHLHQGKADHFPAERFAIEERVIREADQIVALCPQDEEDLVTYYKADAERITIIPNGYNANDFYPIDKLLARMVLGLDNKEPVILQLGRLVPRKGIDTLIVALKQLRQKHGITARLLVVGGESDEPDPAVTPEIGRLEELADKEGVGNRVTFIGRRGRDTLRYYYNAADVFVTTPWYEPFGITPLEAMACGTPVVGSNVGGIKFTIKDGFSGFLVPPKNPEILAERLSELLKSRKLLTYFSENALRQVENFSWARVASQTAAMYEKVVLENPLRIEGESEALSVIDAGFDGLMQALWRSKRSLRVSSLDASMALIRVLSQGGKVLVCGNGGSAAESQHFAAELLGRFEAGKRRGLPVVPLTADGTFMTAWSNDFSFDDVFSRQVAALGQPGDALVCLTTSGESRNLLSALKMARARGIFCIVLSGKTGGQAVQLADIALVVPSSETTHVQEVQLNLIHTICKIVEQKILEDDKARDRAVRSTYKELEDLLTKKARRK